MQKFAFFSVAELFKDYGILLINNPTSGTSRQVGEPLPLYKGRGEEDGLKNGNIEKSSNKTKTLKFRYYKIYREIIVDKLLTKKG